MPERLKVVLGAVNTYLVLAGVFVTVVAGEVAPLLDSERAETVARVAVTVVAWLGAATAIIRRSTEVPVHERGVLPSGHTYVDARG